jgi:glycosyltransferase involved in cell wall biosynthesis
MKLLICLITFGRLKYTKKTLKSLLDTINVPYYLVICDNDSTDGTRKWLEKNGPQDLLILNPYNFYPGKACNIGWERGLRQFPDATHLMRCDNDMEFSKDWATKAEKYFEAVAPLGQLGLDHTALDTYNDDPRYLTTMNGKTVNAWPGNIGGPCIIRREVYDRGARYDETPWQDLRENENSMITPQEDVKFSLSMHNYRYIYGHPTKKLAWTFANESNRSDFPEYYKKTMKKRGYKI